MTWQDGEEERAESRRRLSERLYQTRIDLARTWKIYRRSLLAIVGLFMCFQSAQFPSLLMILQ